VRSVSHERREKETTRLIEDFLAKLAHALSKQDKNEFSIEEVEDRMKGIVSIFSALSQRWSLGIIYLLYMRTLKFNELRELLPGISSRTLTDKLRMLERSGILTRSVLTSAPVRVSYSLSTRGREIALASLPLVYQLQKQ
jgi:DNA-binding HxlR family transcriptional regulator